MTRVVTIDSHTNVWSFRTHISVPVCRTIFSFSNSRMLYFSMYTTVVWIKVKKLKRQNIKYVLGNVVCFLLVHNHKCQVVIHNINTVSPNSHVTSRPVVTHYERKFIMWTGRCYMTSRWWCVDDVHYNLTIAVAGVPYNLTPPCVFDTGTSPIPYQMSIVNLVVSTCDPCLLSGFPLLTVSSILLLVSNTLCLQHTHTHIDPSMNIPGVYSWSYHLLFVLKRFKNRLLATVSSFLSFPILNLKY